MTQRACRRLTEVEAWIIQTTSRSQGGQGEWLPCCGGKWGDWQLTAFVDHHGNVAHNGWVGQSLSALEPGRINRVSLSIAYPLSQPTPESQTYLCALTWKDRKECSSLLVIINKDSESNAISGQTFFINLWINHIVYLCQIVVDSWGQMSSDQTEHWCSEPEQQPK